MDETGLRGKRNNKATETANFFSNFSRENGLFFSASIPPFATISKKERRSEAARDEKSLRAEIS